MGSPFYPAGLEIDPSAIAPVLYFTAGPSGMQAARVDSLRGHRAILIERENRTGGQLIHFSRAFHKKEFEGVVRFLERQLKKSKVDIRLGKEATGTMVKKIKPDAVIVATGATPALPFTPGVNKPHVHTAIEVLDERVSLKGKTAVIGGGLVGLETALYLVEEGMSPTIIIEPTDKLGWYVRNKVTTHPDIEVRIETTVEEIKDDSIVVQKKGQFEEINVENVVLAVGMRNNNTMAEVLRAEGLVEELYTIGDCNIPRTMKEAFEEAAIVSRRV